MTESELRLIKTLEHNMGPLVLEAFQDPEVTDIMLNHDSRLWVKRHGVARYVGVIDRAYAQIIVSLLGTSIGLTVREEAPIVRGILPVYGHRFEGLVPPVVDAPSFAIRKKATKVYTLEDYVEQGVMPESVFHVIDDVILQYQNMLVIGGTGSGKTTLVNAVIERMSRLCGQDRLTIIEDAAELQSKSPNILFLRSSLHVPTVKLLESCMRLNPTRILFGEVINGAALDLLKSWNTGHPGGLSTIHANSAVGGLYRLELLISEASVSPMHKLIGEAVDICVFIKAKGNSRRITQVAKINKYNSMQNRYEFEYIHNEEAA